MKLLLFTEILKFNTDTSVSTVKPFRFIDNSTSE